MKPTHHRAMLAACGVLTFAAAACAAGPADRVEATGTNEDPLFGLPYGGATYWNANAGDTAYINVCFTKTAVAGKGYDGVSLPAPFPGFAAAKSYIREIMENGWGRAANVYFSGWNDTCAAASPTGPDADVPDRDHLNPNRLMINFLPASAPYGRSSADINGKSPSDGMGGGLDNLIHLNWNGATIDYYRYETLHEVGHALGFEHEQDRPDNYSNGVLITCKYYDASQDPLNETGGTNYTTFVDGNSVMCYDVNPSTLSPGDIMGVQVRYGRKPRGSLVGFHGLCANISGASTSDGAFVGAWACTGSWNDTWERSAATAGSHFQTETNNRCLSVSNGQLVANSCSDVVAESFNFGDATSIGAEIRGLGDLCLAWSGSRLTMETCNGSSAQRWDMFHQTSSQTLAQIRWVGGSNVCLSTISATGAMGERLTVAACSQTDRKQQFLGSYAGIIEPMDSSYCLNVSGGLPTPGSEIGLWDQCSTTPQNEQFYVHGHVRNNGKCLAYANSASPGDAIVTQTCSSATNQLWDYYF